MAVTTPRETRTDPVAELSKKVEVGFARTDERIGALDKRVDALDKKMDAGFEKVDENIEAGLARIDADVRELRGEVRSGLDKFDKKFDRLLWGLLTVAVSSSATLIHAFASQGG